jgi:hypothetical protein
MRMVALGRGFALAACVALMGCSAGADSAHPAPGSAVPGSAVLVTPSPTGDTGSAPSTPLEPSSASASSTPLEPSSASPTPAASVRIVLPSGSAAPASSSSPCAVSTTVTVLGGWDPDWPIAELVSCLGGTTVDVTGYLAESWGIGGVPNDLEPEWLGEWPGLPKVLWLKPHPADGCFEETDCVWLFVYAPDPSVLRLAPDRWVTISGHFDDPAATTCHWAGRGGDPVPVDQAIETCRGHFVATSIADADPPSP